MLLKNYITTGGMDPSFALTTVSVPMKVMTTMVGLAIPMMRKTYAAAAAGVDLSIEPSSVTAVTMVHQGVMPRW